VSLLAFSSCAGFPGAASGSPEAGGADSPGAAVREDGASGDGADKNKPAWVDKPDTVYDEKLYVSAVGAAGDRRQAEAMAFGNLTAYFGQSVKSNFAAVEKYKEQVASGTVDISASSEAVQAVEVSSSMESLIGAEIKDVWNDRANNLYYAVAVMDKAKTALLYKDMIDANLGLIGRMTNVPEARRDTIETVAAYYLAAGLADANSVFATVLSLVGGGGASGLKTRDDYIYEAKEIAARIPVNVAVEVLMESESRDEVKKDIGERVKSAFAAVLGSAGFITGGGDSRYIIKARINVTAADLPGVPVKSSRYVVVADFTDVHAASVLFPFSIDGRDSHLSQSEADQRALRKAEARIKEEYGELLQNHLSGGLPRE
jgi:hypothetical protein